MNRKINKEKIVNFMYAFIAIVICIPIFWYSIIGPNDVSTADSKEVYYLWHTYQYVENTSIDDNKDIYDEFEADRCLKYGFVASYDTAKGHPDILVKSGWRDIKGVYIKSNTLGKGSKRHIIKMYAFVTIVFVAVGIKQRKRKLIIYDEA